MTSLITRSLKAPFHWALSVPAIRRRLIFQLQHEYYAELGNRVPLGAGYVCPWPTAMSAESFAEIFVKGEYAPVFERIELPQRWLDLGSHAGFFSLYVAWLRARRGLPGDLEALLVDADSRAQAYFGALRAANRDLRGFRFLHGMIAGGSGSGRFCEREFMASSGSAAGSDGVLRMVPVATAAMLKTLLAPPYDLVKIDVEGGEYDFLLGYEEIWSLARTIVMEWHSFHPGGGGRDQILQMALERGFSEISLPAQPHATPGAGVMLLRNSRMAAR